jgi:hypothetical protein
MTKISFIFITLVKTVDLYFQEFCSAFHYVLHSENRVEVQLITTVDTRKNRLSPAVIDSDTILT